MCTRMMMSKRQLRNSNIDHKTNHSFNHLGRSIRSPMKIIFLMSVLLLASCNGGIYHGPSKGSLNPAAYITNGERIYFSGINAAGIQINSNSGDSHMDMHRQMHGGGCASCHGSDREGQRLWPRFWVKAPALTADALFGADAHKSGSDGHGDHGSYDDDSLRRAITSGVDPSGEHLDQAMPRWAMSRSDLDDLVTFLKQSHVHE